MQRFAKTEVLLGGTCALDSILATQKVIAAPAATPARAMLQPASLLLPRRPLAGEFDRPSASPAVLSGRPDIFGSVALKVGRTPLSARWHRVEHASLTGQPARFARNLSDMAPVQRLEAVNRYVNRHVTFVDDRVQHGRADVWSAAADTLNRGRGDCE